MFDHVGQLADVPRPTVRMHGGQDFRRKQRILRPNGGAESAGQMSGQDFDVVGPLPQRRQRDLERVDPEPQVLAKFTLDDHAVQVAIGCANDPNVARVGLVLADASNFAALQEAEQFGLHALG